MIEQVKSLWQKHESTPVPAGFRGVLVDGINLTALHCEIAANIIAFIETGGRLGPNRLEFMRERRKTLNKSLELLQGPSKEYFANLEKISDLVMRGR